MQRGTTTSRNFIARHVAIRQLVISNVALFLAIFILFQTGHQVVKADANNDNAPNGETQLQFNLASRYQIGPNSIQTRYADLDGDGLIDTVAVNAGQVNPNPTISILFGISRGKFSDRIELPTYLIGQTVALGDLNDDGRPDIVVASFYQSGIAVFLNQGQRQFSEPIFTIPPERQFFDLAIADFDGDGHNDVVGLEDQIDQRLRFFHFNADGTLTIFATLLQNSGNTSYEAVMRVGDINGDGRADVVLAGGGPFGVRGFNFVYGQPPGGSLTMTFGFAVQDMTVGIAIADFDNDGDADMAIAFRDTTTPTRHSVQIFQNDGSGTFLALPKIFLEYAFPPTDITSGDFNNDGKQDLAVLVGSAYDDGLMVLVTNGNGDCTYGDDRYYAVSASSSIFAAKLAPSGKMDLLTASSFLDQTNHVSVLINDGPQGFEAPLVKLWGPNFIDAADFDNDGYLDMASSWATIYNNISGADISINDKHGGFFEEVTYPSPAALSDMKVGDFNADGNADAVTSHAYSSRKLAVYIGHGTGTLDAPVTTSFPEQLETMIIGDFNRDGKDDVFVVDAAGNGFCMLSAGDGTFSTAPNSPFATGGRLPELQKGDFDLDGNLDLVIAGKLWIGDGTGKFTQSALTLPSLAFYVTGDFNGDGKLDLAGTNGDFLVGVLGDGHGAFTGTFSRVIPNNEGYNTVQSLVSADFDLDGFDDIAFIMKDNLMGNLIVFPSGGTNASWKAPIFFGVGTATRTLLAADFNGDRKPDLEWLGDNSRGVIYNITPRSSNRSQFDFDGDGKTDISIFRPNGATGSEWWYLKSSNGGNFATQFGSPTDKLVAADYTGDGKADIAFFRPSTGQWFILRSEDSSFYAFPFGAAGDVPAPADYDGDGKADAAVFRTSNSTWFIQNTGGGTTIQAFGATGDLPVVGDYDGDGKSDLAIFRPNGATGSEWWILRSTAGLIAMQFGTPTDKTVVGDYTGDGKTDVAFWRPSTGEWYILRSEDSSFYAFPFGSSTDIPAPGDYDGDGKTDAGVFRPSNSTWFVNKSTGGTLIQQFGSTGDVPVPNEFVR